MALLAAAGAVAGPAGAVVGAVGSAVGGAVGSVAGSAAGSVAGSVGSVVGGVASSVASAGIFAVFDAAGQWVASGAVWLLGQVGRAMSATTSLNLSSGWFSQHVSVMATLAAAVVLPMICCAIIQALFRQSPSMLVRAVLVQLPLALLLTGVVVELVRMALAVTDALSAQLLAGAGVDTTNILAPVSSVLVGAGLIAPGVPAFVVFTGGLLVAVAALGLWLELVARAAAVSVATLFLPLALAALVWPAVAHWCRRLVDTLVALVLSKLVIAAVLSLAVGAVAGGLDLGASGANGGGFTAVITGIALLFIATVSPFTLLRLIPAFEAGAVSHLESARHRLAAPAIEVRNLAAEKAKRVKGGDDIATAATAGTGPGHVAAAAGGDGAAGAAAGPTLMTGPPMSPPVAAGWNNAGRPDVGGVGPDDHGRHQNEGGGAGRDSDRP